ncbi:hypothetical protein EG329_006679 [Mollisiaceae sp. DMI_Dod_QoI]|nr:hypothetical protein EG329_006679 [Helotiales sp. DMI_Dod_QoI]
MPYPQIQRVYVSTPLHMKDEHRFRDNLRKYWNLPLAELYKIGFKLDKRSIKALNDIRIRYWPVSRSEQLVQRKHLAFDLIAGLPCRSVDQLDLFDEVLTATTSIARFPLPNAYPVLNLKNGEIYLHISTNALLQKTRQRLMGGLKSDKLPVVEILGRHLNLLDLGRIPLFGHLPEDDTERILQSLRRDFPLGLPMGFADALVFVGPEKQNPNKPGVATRQVIKVYPFGKST